jgi:hypothetical protein
MVPHFRTDLCPVLCLAYSVPVPGIPCAVVPEWAAWELQVRGTRLSLGIASAARDRLSGLYHTGCLLARFDSGKTRQSSFEKA